MGNVKNKMGIIETYWGTINAHCSSKVAASFMLCPFYFRRVSDSSVQIEPRAAESAPQYQPRAADL